MLPMIRLPRPIYISVVVLANILACSFLAWNGWSIYQRYLAGAITVFSSPKQNSTAHSLARRIPLDTVIQQHLFGVTDRANDAGLPKSTMTSETKQKLTLSGVISSTDSNMARAIIAVKNGKQNTYGIGGIIEGTDSMISDIATDKVILDRNGILESLTIVRVQDNGVASAASNQSDGGSMENLLPTANTDPNAVSPLSSMTGPVSQIPSVSTNKSETRAPGIPVSIPGMTLPSVPGGGPAAQSPADTGPGTGSQAPTNPAPGLDIQPPSSASGPEGNKQA